ncbi:MAG: GYD domain-containing protein [Chloroflexota bacterium]|nr:GYD domain-containing protein [Chloroflexota bacterium]
MEEFKDVDDASLVETCEKVKGSVTYDDAWTVKGDSSMSAYIMLGRFTQQGIEAIKEVLTRDVAAEQTIQAMGAELKGLYYVMGQYDFVAIIEAPDDETVAKLVLAIGSLGNIRTETLRAYTEDEFAKIIAALP